MKGTPTSPEMIGQIMALYGSSIQHQGDRERAWRIAIHSLKGNRQ